MSETTRAEWPKIILALDLEADEAEAVLEETAGLVTCVKVGLRHMASGEHAALARILARRGMDLFLDGKFHDIPNTVAAAARSAVRLGARFFTVHASGGRDMMAAARETAVEASEKAGRGTPSLPVAVTVLTSLDEKTWKGLFAGTRAVQDQVLHLVEEALHAGVRAVVASPLEVPAIRARFGKDVTVITPGVRPKWAAVGDQRRIAAPGVAVKAGASSLVIGRPILAPPAEVGGRRAAVERILKEIDDAAAG